LNLKPAEAKIFRIGKDETERILDLKANLDYYKFLIAHASYYLITFKSPIVVINVETGEYQDIDFEDEDWENCLIDSHVDTSKISLGVRTGSLSRLLVLEVANEEQKSRLDGWGIWRSKCVAESGNGLERHFYEMPADFQPISSDVSGTDIRIYGEGDLAPLPPFIDPATQLEWRWQDAAWECTPTPLPSAIINFLQAIQQPTAAASEFQDKYSVPWQSPSDDHQAMNMKDTEMTSHSPSPLPPTQDSPSTPSATMPVLDKAIQEFSAAFNELQGIIRELGSQEEQKTAADLENKALEHYYRELFTDAPGGYLVIDTEATIQECNQAAADMLGMHKDFLSGKRLEVFVIQKDYYSLYSLMDQALEGNETRTATVHLLPPSGTPIPVFLSIAARKNPAGEFIGFNCLMHHLTQGQQDEESLKNKITQLENCLTGLVKAFSTASEMQNPYASGHQKRVAQLAVAIAREMGFSPDLVEGVNIIGFLHDIGSVAMPSIFLNKPGLLTIVESNILKTHSQMGHDLLKDIEFSWPVAKAIQQHHESWNGSGYPSGLSGEDIIMEARILAVAEVVEAMVSPAPYGKALAIEKAADELNKGKGILYDPTVVDACLKLLMEGGFKFS